MRPVITIFVLIMAIAGSGLTSVLQAGEECSAATLQGDYLVTGGAEAPSDEPRPGFPVRTVSVHTYDGKGNVSVLQTISNGGQIIRRRTVRGTYTLDSDCTGTFMINETEWDIFVTRDGKEGAYIRVDEGTIATRTIKKR